MPKIITLETPRLKLREWRDGDLDAWAAMSSDSRVMEYFAEKLDRPAADAMAKRMRDGLERDGYGWWALEIKGGPEFAGVIVLQEVSLAARFSPATEIGWRLAAGVWGNGYATEGARAALDFAFGHLNRQEIVAITAVGNARSRQVMQRLGMTYDPKDDFAHPRLEPGHPLRPHVLYRLRRTASS